MRKKISVFIGIMLLSLMMFGCSNNSDTLKIPKNLELKDEYKKDVNEKYAENFNKCTSNAIVMYKNINEMTKEDLEKINDLAKTLIESKSGSELSESEMLIGKKITDVNSELIYYRLGNKSEESKVKIKEDIQVLLDLYK